MDVALKGFLQGSIPVVVFVGGAHHFTKKLKTSKPVLYYGSLLAGLGLAYAVVEGKIKAPFMNAEGGGEMTCNDKLNEAYDWIGFHNGEENLREFMDSIGIKDEEFGAETFEDLYYCSKCDEGFSSINPTDEGQFCDSCLPSSATLHDEMERITMDAETFENNHTIEVSKGDMYAVRPKIRKWIRAMQEKGFSYIIRKDQTPGLEAYVDSPSEFLVYEIGNIDDITDWVEADSMEFGEYNDEMKLYISTKNNEIYTSRYGETNRHASRSVIYFPAKGIGLAYGAESFEASGTKKPKLTPKQKQALDLMKYSYGANNNEYAYVEVDNRGWKAYRTRQVQALLDKGLIEIDRAENKNFWGYVRNYEAYIVKLTPLAWEYKYEDPIRKDTPYLRRYQQDGDKMV